MAAITNFFSILTEQNFNNLLLFLILHKINLVDEWMLSLVIFNAAKSYLNVEIIQNGYRSSAI